MIAINFCSSNGLNRFIPQFGQVCCRHGRTFAPQRKNINSAGLLDGASLLDGLSPIDWSCGPAPMYVDRSVSSILLPRYSYGRFRRRSLSIPNSGTTGPSPPLESMKSLCRPTPPPSPSPILSRRRRRQP
jgi:hypothetical protein